MSAPKHCAPFSKVLIPLLAKALGKSRRILDPFAGIGLVGLVKKHGVTGTITTVEIEPEWAQAEAEGCDNRVTGDATCLPFGAGSFDAVVTSPTYGNRMADNFSPAPSTKKWRRIGYRFALGRRLHDRNTGQMHWGEEYRFMHRQAWAEVARVLEPGGRFVLNVSDHIKGGEVVRVSDWHRETCKSLGFVLLEHVQVATPRMRFGQNHKARVEHENVYVFERGPS